MKRGCSRLPNIFGPLFGANAHTTMPALLRKEKYALLNENYPEIGILVLQANMPTKSTFSIESLLRTVSFAGSMLIFLSILQSYIFYATFNIQITNYISFSESILLFLNEISVLLLYAMLVMTAYYLTLGIFRLFIPQVKAIDILVPNENSKWLHKLISLTIAVYPVSYLLYAIILNTAHHSHPKYFYFWLVSSIFIEVVVFSGIIEIWKRIRQIKPFIGRRVFMYFIGMSILFFYIWSLDRQLFLFHRNQINKAVVAWTKDRRVFLTSDSIQFLGSTGQYIFCYDLKSDRSIVIRTAQFDRVEFGAYANLPGFSVFDMLYH
jgi:hypothetical protein